MKGSITKKLVMTYSAVLGAFLIITVLLLNITARKSLEKTIINNLNTESAIIEELYREQIITISNTKNKNHSVDNMRDSIKAWFSNIEGLAKIGFASDIALVIKTYNNRFGVFTLGETPNEVDFKEISTDNLSKSLKAEPFFFNISGSRTAYFAVSRPITDSNNSSFKAWIIAYTSVSDINKLVRDMNLQGAFALGIALIVAAFLSYYLSLNISKPIKILKNQAEKIASRNFNTRVKISTGDEIESLAQAMNKIAGDLSDYDLSQKRFLQNVSHELKTPVMSIMGYAEGIRDEVIEDKEKALNIIVDECERLQRLINEVLFLSKLETIEEFYIFKNENLNEVLLQIKDKIQSVIDRAGLTFEMKHDVDLSILMDKDKFIQAIINLLSNAVRYSTSRIVLETKLECNQLFLKVWDDGCGLDEHELSHVFERFYKGKKGSTGLGMTITKAIIEKHKGSITVDNRPEGGAIFTVVLPVEL